MKFIPATHGTEIKRLDYSKTVIFPPETFASPGHQLQTVTIPPQTKQREHKHDRQTEVVYAISGTCIVYLNGSEYEMKPGDAFVTEPGDWHNLWNRSPDPFTCVVFKIDYGGDGDTTWKE